VISLTLPFGRALYPTLALTRSTPNLAAQGPQARSNPNPHIPLPFPMLSKTISRPLRRYRSSEATAALNLLRLRSACQGLPAKNP
jgi:hypothetical protein